MTNEEDEKRIKHMEFVQAVIARMASNSFQIKGWSVTIVTALFALTGVTTKPIFILIALLPALSFWGLDAYYLRQERLFRKLYKNLQLSFENKVDINKTVKPFSLSTKDYQSEVIWFKVLRSPTILVFHGVIIGAILFFFLIYTA
ncbi:MAG: hypothetical protein QNJ54_18255 [Prochloraceae cyanobacterium]|nr:hypothetical protein [Prochloraceae cyanobacterium]